MDKEQIKDYSLAINCSVFRHLLKNRENPEVNELMKIVIDHA